MNALRDRIQSTLDANADTRRQAELDLKYVCLCLIVFMRIYLELIIFPGIGRDATRIHRRFAGYSAGRTKQCCSTFWYGQTPP